MVVVNKQIGTSTEDWSLGASFQCGGTARTKGETFSPFDISAIKSKMTGNGKENSGEGACAVLKTVFMQTQNGEKPFPAIGRRRPVCLFATLSDQIQTLWWTVWVGSVFLVGAHLHQTTDKNLMFELCIKQA